MGKNLCHNGGRFNYVPNRKFGFIKRSSSLIIVIFHYLIYCMRINSIESQPNYYFPQITSNLQSNRSISLTTSSFQEPTPPLEPNLSPSTKFYYSKKNNTRDKTQIISPTVRLRKRYDSHEPDVTMYSLIFQSEYIGPFNSWKSENSLIYENSFDLVEAGSGSEPSTWSEEVNSITEDSSPIVEADPRAISPTPVLIDFTTQGMSLYGTSLTTNNKPPQLNKRIPKLALTAGRVWRYFIPSDTFIDEDGDLYKLNTSIKLLVSDTSVNSQEENNSLSSVNSYYSWLQYDPNTLLIYGLPTENEAGNHNFVLTVTDRFGLTSEEVFEINVRQHQSTRAFSHLFNIDKIEYDKRRFISLVDAIGEFVKRISTLVYQEQPFRNLIVQNINVNGDRSQHNPQYSEDLSILSFNLGWSNSTLPIYPCNITQIENITRYLINHQILQYDWNLEQSNKLNLLPSPTLIKALAPDFVPTSISIYLQGACSDKEQTKILNSSENTLIVKNKIGQLTWKLGEIIQYSIPEDTFSIGEKAVKNSDLSLTLLSIDGLNLEKSPEYNYIDFHQDTNTIYGIPYEQGIHTGQRELILRATHNSSNQVVREVFIINIEEQDLTLQNNRAFKMSLYFRMRTVTFGPRERVQLANRMISVLSTNGIDAFRESQNPEMVVIDIQKFVKPSHNNIDDNPMEENKIIKVFDDLIMNPSEDFITEQNYLYKFIWTNSSIGYKGDCPVEVINQHILGALKSSMENYQITNSIPMNPDKTNASDLLHFYFEPEVNLLLLRFEPINACNNALKSYDVGYSIEADEMDRATEATEIIIESTTANTITSNKELMNLNLDDPENDVYWSIVLLLVLLVAVIYTIITLALGIHTFFINQDKKHRFQVGLAQARQNSMYLSSMLLSNQVNVNDLSDQLLPSNSNRCQYIVHDEDKVSRKPVILDNERGLLATTMIPTTVQLTSGGVQTTPIKHSYSTMESNWRPDLYQLMQPTIFENQQSVTLNRRSNQSGSIQQFMNQHASMTNLNHSQSILPLGPIGNPLPVIPQGQVSIVYSQVPVANGPIEQQNYYSLKRQFDNQRSVQSNIMSNRILQPYEPTVEPVIVEQINSPDKIYADKNQNSNGVNRLNSYNNRSPSYSSSTSATTQSIISVPNVTNKQRSQV